MSARLPSSVADLTFRYNADNKHIEICGHQNRVVKKIKPADARHFQRARGERMRIAVDGRVMEVFVRDLKKAIGSPLLEQYRALGTAEGFRTAISRISSSKDCTSVRERLSAVLAAQGLFLDQLDPARAADSDSVQANARRLFETLRDAKEALGTHPQTAALYSREMDKIMGQAAARAGDATVKAFELIKSQSTARELDQILESGDLEEFLRKRGVDFLMGQYLEQQDPDLYRDYPGLLEGLYSDLVDLREQLEPLLAVKIQLLQLIDDLIADCVGCMYARPSNEEARQTQLGNQRDQAIVKFLEGAGEDAAQRLEDLLRAQHVDLTKLPKNASAAAGSSQLTQEDIERRANAEAAFKILRRAFQLYGEGKIQGEAVPKALQQLAERLDPYVDADGWAVLKDQIETRATDHATKQLLMQGEGGAAERLGALFVELDIDIDNFQAVGEAKASKAYNLVCDVLERHMEGEIQGDEVLIALADLWKKLSAQNNPHVSDDLWQEFGNELRAHVVDMRMAARQKSQTPTDYRKALRDASGDFAALWKLYEDLGPEVRRYQEQLPHVTTQLQDWVENKFFDGWQQDPLLASVFSSSEDTDGQRGLGKIYAMIVQNPKWRLEATESLRRKVRQKLETGAMPDLLTRPFSYGYGSEAQPITIDQMSALWEDCIGSITYTHAVGILTAEGTDTRPLLAALIDAKAARRRNPPVVESLVSAGRRGRHPLDQAEQKRLSFRDVQRMPEVSETIHFNQIHDAVYVLDLSMDGSDEIALVKAFNKAKLQIDKIKKEKLNADGQLVIVGISLERLVGDPSWLQKLKLFEELASETGSPHCVVSPEFGYGIDHLRGMINGLW